MHHAAVMLVSSRMPDLRSGMRVGIARTVGRTLEAAALHPARYSKRGVQVFEYGAAEHGQVGLPLLDGELPAEHAAIVGPYSLPPPGVVELFDARLVGSSPVAFTRRGEPLLESALGRHEVLRASLGVSTKAMLRGMALRLGCDALLSASAPRLGHVVSLCNAYCRGYYHWVIDDLLQLEAVEAYARVRGRPQLLLPPSPPRFQLESLRLLGWGDDDIVYWDAGHGLSRVWRLGVPQLQRDYPYVSGRACRWLGERARAGAGCSRESGPRRRIYVSRRNASARRVVNEDAVIGELSRWGFEVHCLEDLSVADQVRLFADAEMIVGAHGAGLVNMVFAREASVIELSDVYPYYVPFFHALAHALSFPYAFFECEAAVDTHLRVDVDRLGRLLGRLCDKAPAPARADSPVPSVVEYPRSAQPGVPAVQLASAEVHGDNGPRELTDARAEVAADAGLE